MKKTPLYDEHVAMGAHMVHASGWVLPLHYGSPLEEHRAVRETCGIFDVSHMGVMDLVGRRVTLLLRFLLSNDVARIPQPGQAQYSLMLNMHAGISDDLIVYRISEDRFSLVVNAETQKKALAWMRVHAPSYGVDVVERRDLAVLAVQGPQAAKYIGLSLPTDVGNRHPTHHGRAIDLKPFHCLEEGGWRVARTGYTGEDGFELMIPVENSVTLWNSFIRFGVVPAGLAARDTLRLEAGFNLYGRDIDGNTTPLESGLGWLIAWEPLDRDFVGRRILQSLWGETPAYRRVGLILQGEGRLRDRMDILHEDHVVGTLSSAGYSPTLDKYIALARVKSHVPIGTVCDVEADHRRQPVQVVRPPFVRFGKPVFQVR